MLSRLMGVLVLVVCAQPVLAQKALDCRVAANPGLCIDAQKQLIAEASAFNAGDYSALRNRAYCLWSGCDGAMTTNRRESCAIRRKIMQRFAKTQVDSGDEGNFTACVTAGY